MKYILETDNKICREYGNTVTEIVNKMYAIEDNLDFLLKTHEEQYPKKTSTTLINQFTNTSEILCDLNSANDEFYFYSGNIKDSVYIEVVTKEVAISNDMDFLLADERKVYVLGGVYSYYTKLADTDYYFRFM